MTNLLISDEKPSLGLIGFGAFGQLAAKTLAPHFALVVHDPDPKAQAAMARQELCPARFARAAACPVVVLAAPVAALGEIVPALGPHLAPGALVLDVGSVKIGPAALLEAHVPADVEIIATHPLFGPQSAADGLSGLKIALCPLRGARAGRVAAWLRRALGLKVIVTTPEAHDRELAAVQGLTHLIARALDGMVAPTALTTRSYELLMQAVAMVSADAPGVYDAIERANPYAAPLRARFLARLAELAQEGDREGAQAPALWAQSQ